MKFTEQYIKMCDCEEVQENKRKQLFHFPYQHHIQSWIFQYGNCQYKLLKDFYDWCTEQKDKLKACTMEEMWLQFYMWRDHYKIWDGKKWIKE
jgi:hypothetical protein